MRFFTALSGGWEMTVPIVTEERWRRTSLRVYHFDALRVLFYQNNKVHLMDRPRCWDQTLTLLERTEVT